MVHKQSSFDFKNKNIVILGLARQGSALARFFVRAGANVTVSDLAPADKLQSELDGLGDLPVNLVLGEHPTSLLQDCDLLCLSGGVPPQIPLVQEAISRGIPLSNDSLLTMQLAPCPVVAITGSSGKTTTTTLVGHMLEASFAETGRTVHVGGNIGRPLLDRLHEIGAGDLIVLELSSFQLELFDPDIAFGNLDNLGPDVAAILNVTPNHLDRHPDMAAYIEAKSNLVRQMKLGATLILNADDPVTSRFAADQKDRLAVPDEWRTEQILASARTQINQKRVKLVWFSRRRNVAPGAWLDGERLMVGDEELCLRSEVQLRGEHNISNLLAAAAISGAAGASVQAMRTVAHTFAGVPHRLEVVRQQHGITWINDSIATAPERAVAGLRSFEPGTQTLILLAGGKDKNLPWDTFADEVLERVSFLIGFGQAGPMIVEKVKHRAEFRRHTAPNCAVVQRLDEAVRLAAQVAGENSVVLLSPGGTSYDAYKNFEERGEHFRRLVLDIQAQHI